MDAKELHSKSIAGNVERESPEEDLECAVCLQSCIHPVRLPCSHIFCFLCVKGVANQSKRCAMCRKEIPADFLDNPNLLKKIEKETDDEGYQWFYEGRNGWWQYDQRTSRDLEGAFNRGQRTYEVLVAGFLYSVDFDRMVQQRRNDPSRRRRIKRDLSTIPKKGVAGLKAFGESPTPEEIPTEGEPDDGNTPPPPSPSALELDNPDSVTELSPELQSVQLLHSNLHRNREWRDPAGASSGRPERVAVTTRLRHNSPPMRLHYRNDASDDVTDDVRRGENLSSSVEETTTAMRNFTLEAEASTATEYYSLDDTEEYNLPTDNESL